jgi:excinuclease ABC subunit A
MAEQITIRGARLHNLKNISLSIPKNRLVVFSGLSGSGKSSLAFDILFQEGQRRYLESLGLVTFGMAKPPVDSISGLSPSISVDQHLSSSSPRSTVGTMTEVYTYMRVLYARLGRRPCPGCGQEVLPVFDLTGTSWQGESRADDDEAAPETYFPCPHCGAPVPEIGMAHFSFNKPDGACPTCTGLGSVHQANIERLADRQKSIPEGAVAGWDTQYIRYSLSCLEAAAAYYGFEFDASRAIRDYTPAQHDLLFYGVHSPQFRRHFPGIELPDAVSRGRYEGLATAVLRRYAERILDADYREKMEELLVTETCPDCLGSRLRPESRAVRLDGWSIVETARLPLSELWAWLESCARGLSGREIEIARPILDDLQERIARLVEVGVGYLSMERASPTLSAGEAHRLRLASMLGSGLSGVLYVFDEPTIGLHQRDTQRMIALLRRLRDLGNTVLVVEHDLEVIAAADHLVDFGPGGGKHGGRVVAQGAPAEVMEHRESLTGDYLARRAAIPMPGQRRAPDGRAITIHGARHHNLQDITVSLPLGLLVAVTGVSGSGKSSLIFDILDPAVRQRLYAAGAAPGEHGRIEGLEQVGRIISIDQAHIGRIPRSNAATYADIFTPIREAFAATPEARRRGLTARTFSFNVPGGRCERCEGAGVLSVRMHFLPDVEVRCPVCQGRRFTSETLAVQYQGLDIAQVLELTVEEALELFAGVRAARSRLQVLADVGLGYLQLGQPATTLSGGEAQRVKLAKELGRRSAGSTLYLLDEPTTGLHLADAARLLGLLERLVEAGNTVVVVEHNLELVKCADWIIDLGPEGGAAGGRLVAQGTPEQVAQADASYTGQFLRKLLRG